jgi:carboxyl-terminal processing protease
MMKRLGFVAFLALFSCSSNAFLPTNSVFQPDIIPTRTTLHHQLPTNEQEKKATWTRLLSSRLSSNVVGVAMIMASTLFLPWQLELGATPNTNALAAIHLTPSRANALTEEQALVADVWKEVTRQYVDTTYNGLGEDGWRQKRLDAVKAVTNIGPDDKEKVYSTIRNMLAALNDPYTRFLTPEQYDSLVNYAKGGSAGGVGVSLVVDPASGNVVVASVSKDGPAQKGGIVPGDVILDVDGMDMKAATAELVAAKCRGEPGSNVNMSIRHNGKTMAMTLKRAKIKVNPVEASTITIDNKKIGLLKVAAFSQQTTSQIVDALRNVKGTSAIVIDLRGNAGGYMPAGVDVAKLFLEPQTRIISEVDKSGRATVYLSDGVGSDTKTPLYILVDKRTASASEILTAALQDNHRAVIVGASETFGKGRIQNVQGLEDGSGVAVTKAKYMTPTGKDIHGVGITPERKVPSCGPDNSAETCLDGII